jgi:hypothetical protein
MKRHILLLAIALLSACAFNNFASSAQPLEGVIRNYNTGEPIPDAFVVARWFVESGNLGHSGGSICFHVEVAKSDAQGHYYFPVPEVRSDYSDVRNPRTFVVAYKPGYRWEPEVNGAPTPADQLIESNDDPGDRVDILLDVRKNVSCMGAGDSMNNLLELFKSLYSEASRLAATKDEKISAISLLQDVEGIELGGDIASKRFFERLGKIK